MKKQKPVYGTTSFTMPIKKNKAAFLEFLRKGIEKATDDMVEDLKRQMFPVDNEKIRDTFERMAFHRDNYNHLRRRLRGLIGAEKKRRGFQGLAASISTAVKK